MKRWKPKKGKKGSAMEEITSDEFDSFEIGRHPSVSEYFTEKRWFKHRALLGTVVFDHDCEWGWLALAKHECGKYRAIDMGTSITTQAKAIQELQKCLKANEELEIEPGTSPMMQSQDDVVDMLSKLTGDTKEHARKVLESLKHSSGNKA